MCVGVCVCGRAPVCGWMDPGGSLPHAFERGVFWKDGHVTGVTRWGGGGKIRKKRVFLPVTFVLDTVYVISG